MSDETGVRKLPVWRTVKAAYLVIFHNPKLAIKLAAVPLAFSILPLLIQTYLWSGMTAEEVALSMQSDFNIVALIQVVSVLGFLAMIPMITAWHRLVILGHAHPDARISYGIKKTEWSYLGKLILFGLLCALFMVPAIVVPVIIGAALPSAGGFHIAVIAIMIIAMLFIYAFIFRASLVFPAAAIGESLSFRESWRLSKGNTWRIIFTTILAALPTSVIMFVVSLAFAGMFFFDPTTDAFPSFNSQLIVSAIHTPLWIIGTCVGISVWSWCYRYLVQKEPVILPGE